MHLITFVGPGTRLQSFSRRGRLLLPFLMSLLVLVVPGVAGATELHASPGSLDSVFASAQGGDTVLLAAGSYGVFHGGVKSSVVTVKPEAGASVTLGASFSGASNVRLEGLTITDAVLLGSTTNVSIVGSTFTGQAIVRTTSANAGILFDADNWRNQNVVQGGFDARLEVVTTGSPNGVTVQNSLFSGGNADGVQESSDGLRILNNEFVGLTPSNGTHTDAIQLLGSRTLIDGNWIHATVAQPIGGFDWPKHETITNNVIDSGPKGYPYAITLTGDTGSTVAHNTLVAGPCVFNLSCGFLRLQEATPASSGTIVRDNIVTAVGVETANKPAQNDYNLCVPSGCAGSHSLNGVPTYSGGASPSSWAGYALTASSKGHLAASDGTDIGADVVGRGFPLVPVPPAPAGGKVPGGTSPVGSLLPGRTSPAGTLPGGTSVAAGSATRGSSARPAFATKRLGYATVTVPTHVSWARLRARGLQVSVVALRRADVKISLLPSRLRPLAHRHIVVDRGTRTLLVRPDRRRLGRRRGFTMTLRVAVKYAGTSTETARRWTVRVSG